MGTDTSRIAVRQDLGPPQELSPAADGRGQRMHTKYRAALGSGVVNAPAGVGQAEAAATAGGAYGGSGAPAGTTDTDGGGTVINGADVQLIFWGSYWGGTPSPSVAQVTDAVSTILASPYMSALRQYRNIGNGRLRGTTSVSSDPPGPFSNGDVVNLINGMIDGGTEPEPDEDWQVLYMVILPPGVKNSNAALAGEHTFFTWSDYDLFDSDSDPVHYGWVLNDGTSDGITKVFSHELVEACSDPEGNAIQLTAPGICSPSSSSWCEIGDCCQGMVGTVAGVLVQSYWSQQAAGCVVPGGFVLATHSGLLVQSTFGRQGNLELVVPNGGGGLAHLWRNNDDPAIPWSSPTVFGDGRTYDALSLIQSNFGNPGNLEVIAHTGDVLTSYWRDSGPAFHWAGPYDILRGASGNPALIQSRFGQRGNFELVVPLSSGGLAHHSRANDSAGTPWSGGIVFGGGQQYDAVALVQSNFGAPGNLEVVARSGDRMVSFWRDSGPSFTWHGPDPISADGAPIAGATGIPSLVQSRFGTQGNFEMVVPIGGIATHFWRDNDAPGLPWHRGSTFGIQPNSLPIDRLSIIQSNYGNPGNLEVVGRGVVQFTGEPPSSAEWHAWSRDSGPGFSWSYLGYITGG